MEDGVPGSSEKKGDVKTEDAKDESDSKETKTVTTSQQKIHPSSELSEGANNGLSKAKAVSVSSKREIDDEEDEEEEEEEHNLGKDDSLQEDQKTGIQLEEETEIDESQVRRKLMYALF